MRAVPSDSLRDGVLIYQCATPSACPGGSVQGFSASHTVPAGSYGLTPGGTGRRSTRCASARARAAIELLQAVPVAERGRTVDAGNINDFRFAAPIENTFRTYIAAGDYRTERQHNLFGRFNKQDDAHRQRAAVSRRGAGHARAATRTGAGRSGGTRRSAATW